MEAWDDLDLDLFDQLLAQEGLQAEAPLTLPPRVSRQSAPLSFQQRRLWFLEQLSPGGSSYLMSASFRLTGTLLGEALQTALQALVLRHEVLRTRFELLDDRPMMVVEPDVRLSLAHEPFIPPPSASPEETESLLRERIRQQTERPFQLNTAPLLRALLLALGPQEHVLVLTLHHVLCDGASLIMLLQELLTVYQAHALALQTRRPLPPIDQLLPPLSLHYGDFTAWQQSQLHEARQQELLQFWLKALEGSQPLLLPLDFERPQQVTAVVGGFVTGEVSKTLRDRALRLAEGEQCTLATLTLAVFQLLLARYARQETLVCGYALQGRDRLELENMLGLFTQVLAIFGRLTGNPSFRDFLKSLQQTMAAAFEHQELPFEVLVDALNLERHPHMNPLFQVTLVFQLVPKALPALNGLTVAKVGDDTSARFDLELFLYDGPDGLALNLVYDRALFRHETAQRLLETYQVLLEAAVDAPDTPVLNLPMLAPPDRAGFLRRLTETQHFPAERCLHTWFEAQVARSPRRVAVTLEGQSLRYAELNARANRLALELRQQGVGPEKKVALWFDRSLELVIAILGVLKAGGVYVPIDPNYPAARVAFLLEDCGAHLLLTRAGLEESLPESARQRPDLPLLVLPELQDAVAPVPDLPSLNQPSDAAYIIYTSGSTGQPKGVIVEHRQVVRLMESTESLYGFTQSDVWTLFHSYAFDFSVWELWGALLYGGKLVIVPRLVSRSPEAFYALLHQARVTVLNQTPSAFRQLVTTSERLGHPHRLALRYVIFGGERLELSTLRPWLEHYGDEQPALINMYGITETTVHVTARRITLGDVYRNERSLIGKPLADLRLYLLDEQLQPVPAGAVGELVVGGAGVARGYHQRPELTTARFVTDPFVSDPVTGQPGRMYRSGDLARLRVDGELEYLGRMDQQVKIRGFRIELGEIEATLSQHPLVRDAAVLVQPDDTGTPTLLAWVIPALERLSEDAQFRAQLEEHIAGWQTTYDSTYEQANPEHNDAFNIIGWNSSYTRQPLPSQEMALWLDCTLSRLRQLKPQRVLEIGCGTGMLLLNLAGECLAYVGADFSSPALKRVQAAADRRGLRQVRLLHRQADQLQPVVAALESDTVIINSVVQYFPDQEYLERVIGLAVQAVQPATEPLAERGARIFIGDVRSLPLLRTFQTSVCAHRASPGIRRQALRRQVEQALREEEELAIDPGFFLQLPTQYPAITGVTLQVRPYDADNELTRFRYDVVLTFGRTAPPPACETLAERVALGLEADLLLETWLFSDGPDETLETFQARLPGLLTGVPALLPITPLRGAATSRPLTGKILRRLSPLLREFMATRLPEHMIPSAFMLLDALPLTAHGKLDVKALPTPGAQELEIVSDEPLRRSPLEELLTHLWCGVLHRGTVGRDQNFFEIGGHSLRAVQLVNALRESMQVELPLKVLFENPTIAALLPFVEGLLQARGGLPEVPLVPVSRQNPLPASFAQRRMWIIDRLEPGLPTYHMPLMLRIEGPLDLRALRHSLDALLERHEVLRTRLVSRDGEIFQEITPPAPFPLLVLNLQPDVPELQALQAQVEAELAQPFALDVGPLIRARLLIAPPSPLRPESPSSESDRPLHFLLLVMHHSASDGWSLGVLARELAGLYGTFILGSEPGAGRSPLPPLPVQYADFAVWQHRALSAEVRETLRQHWKNTLQGLPPEIDGLTDHPHGRLQQWEGATERFTVPRLLLERLKRLCRQEGVTLFMALLASLKAVLFRYTGQTDLVVGTPVAGRNHKALEGLIGMFLNTLPLRTSLEGSPSFHTLLERVRATTLDAWAHQELPFEEMIAAVAPERDRARHPLFQVMCVLQNLPDAGAPVGLPGGLKLKPQALESGVSRFDLTLLFEESAEGLQAVLEYTRALFEPASIRRLGGHYLQLLEAVCTDPLVPIPQLPLLPPAELSRVLALGRGETVPYDPTETFLTRFLRTAAQCGDAPAILEGDNSLSYRALELDSRRVALRLRQLGVQPGELVAILAPAGEAFFVAMLGIQRCGAGYVPLDPDWPAARLRLMLETSGARLVFVQAGSDARGHGQEALEGFPGQVLVLPELLAELRLSHGEAPDEAQAQARLPVVSPEAPAYLIFTSGSTGRPKGVRVHHANLTHSLVARVHHYQKPVGRYLLLSSVAFDSSVAGIFWTLETGGALVIPPEGTLAGLSSLERVMGQHRVTHLLALPGLYELLLTAGHEQALANLQVVIVAGEDCSSHLLEHHRQRLPHVQLHNEYGPTEATVWCTVWQPAPGERLQPVSIGRPIANTQVYVLDANLQPVPLGRPGELVVGGPGVAAGYFQAEGSAGAPPVGGFVSEAQLAALPPSPAFGAGAGSGAAQASAVPVLYRTGDRARWLEDGRLVLLRRLDQQVKLRGHRIELGEIEAALLEQPGIAAAVAVVQDAGSPEARLIAVLVLEPDAAVSASGLQRALSQHLSQKLPAYMVPSRFVCLPELPRLPNGKVDRIQLMRLPLETLASVDAGGAGQAGTLLRDGGGHTAMGGTALPADVLEAQLLQLFQETFAEQGAHPIDMRSNFFELGGNSLLALRLAHQLEQRLGQAVPLSWLFEEGTLRGLAERLRAGGAAGLTVGERAGGERAGAFDREGREAPTLIRPGAAPALFCFHQAGGHVLEYFTLAHALAQTHASRAGGAGATEKPPAVYGFKARGLDGQQAPLTSVEALATLYREALVAQQPEGPYHLLGHSFGGLLAFEVARQLEAQGATVGRVLLLDTPHPALSRQAESGLSDGEGRTVGRPEDDRVGLWRFVIGQLEAYFGVSLTSNPGASEPDSASSLTDAVLAGEPRAAAEAVAAAFAAVGVTLAGGGATALLGLVEVYRANVQAARLYEAGLLQAGLELLVTPGSLAHAGGDETLGWASSVRELPQVTHLDASHEQLLRAPVVDAVARWVVGSMGR